MFKNCIAYRVTPGFRFDAELLERRPARECSALETGTDGFVAPCDHSTAGLIHHAGGYTLLCWETHQKIMPGSVVAEKLAERAHDFYQREGFKPGKATLRELKDAVLAEMLAQAFVQKRRTFAVQFGDLLFFDTSSVARADGFIEALKIALGQMPLSLLQTKEAPRMKMAEWLRTGEPPEQITIDDEAVLEFPSDSKPIVHYSRSDLDQRDVRERVSAGYLPKKVGLTFDSNVAFILNQDLHITRIAMLDELSTEQRHDQAEDAAEIFDGDVIAGAGVIFQVIRFLVNEFGGYAKPEADLLSEGEDEADPLYADALRLVVAEQKASISQIQRHLRIGYNRAARLVESLEAKGIVTPMDAGGSRRVLVSASLEQS